MKVLFFDHSGHLGGGQLGLLRYLEQPAPFERELLVLEDGELVRRARALGVRVVVLGAADSYLSKFAIAPRVRRAIEGLRPDIVVANSLTAANVVGLSPWRDAVNIAYLRETLSVDSVPPGLKRALMLHRTFAAFDGFVSNSAATRASIPAPLARVPVKIAYPVSGIDAVVDGAPLGSADRFRVLTLSRLEHWKGVHVVVDAYEELARRGVQDHFELRIAGDATLGDPAYLARIATRVACLGSSVTVLGRLDDVQSALDEVDALVIPTLRPEPFGQVMAQGIARGRLIISSAGGGPTEILGPTAAAVFVQAGDIEALADAFQFAHADLGASAAIARRGRAQAELFLDHRTSAALSEAILALGSKVQR